MENRINRNRINREQSVAHKRKIHFWQQFLHLLHVHKEIHIKISINSDLISTERVDFLKHQQLCCDSAF